MESMVITSESLVDDVTVAQDPQCREGGEHSAEQYCVSVAIHELQQFFVISVFWQVTAALKPLNLKP